MDWILSKVTIGNFLRILEFQLETWKLLGLRMFIFDKLGTKNSEAKQVVIRANPSMTEGVPQNWNSKDKQYTLAKTPSKGRVKLNLNYSKNAPWKFAAM